MPYRSACYSAHACSWPQYPLYAQAGGSPWENAVEVLQTAFTSTIARGLSLVAEIEGRSTYNQCQKEQPPLGAPNGERLIDGAVNGMYFDFVRHGYLLRMTAMERAMP